MFKSITRSLTNCSILFLLLLFFYSSLTGCSSFKPIPTRVSGAPIITAASEPLLIGIVYTNIRLPLTMNLDDTTMPDIDPPSSRILEIKEPFTGADVYVQVDANAIGPIAKKNGLKKLHFADQEHFSILGVWATHRTILYGE